MNSEEDVINQLKADKAVLEAQLVRVRADYNALNMIQEIKLVNQSMWFSF